MKKILLIGLLLLTGTIVAQEADYNKWSIELQGGASKATRPFTPGYTSDHANFFQGSVGARYMFNNKFGVKLDFGYNNIESDDDSSLEFKNNYYRGSIQGVANLGNILDFNTFTDWFTILGHGGFGYSSAKADDINFGADEDDAMFHAILGVTPQFKLSERVTFTTDLSIIGHVGQDVTWDGQSSVRAVNGDNASRGFNGMLVNVSAGISINLGSASTHADWYYEADALEEEMDSLRMRIAKIENDMIDDDKDGVPNYLDQDNRTESGVAVNTRGQAIDLNKNGIPDEMESALDARYLKTGSETTVNGDDVIAELIDKGYVNVYFKFNSEEPSVYSLEAINYLVKYMNANTDANATLVGYADEIGNEAYNQKLSEQRAQKINDILVASGVSASRLTVKGGGEDNSVDKSSKYARQLMRRVTFKLN